MFNSPQEHAEYIINFIDTYFSISHLSNAKKELESLKLQFPKSFQPVKEGDLFVGRFYLPLVGFCAQEVSEMGYYADMDGIERLKAQLSDELKAKVSEKVEQFQSQRSINKLNAAYDERITTLLTTDKYEQFPGIGFPLCRMSGTQPDYHKLLSNGILGLKQKITGNSELAQGMRGALDLMRDCCIYLADNTDGEISETLRFIADNKPQTLRQAIQLTIIYWIMSGTKNYGRVDTYLTEFYLNDIKNGITDEQEIEYIKDFFRMIIARGDVFDCRVIVGGLGRKDEENANKVASLCIEASRQLMDVLPQLTLRFHKNQDPALFEQAMDSLASGCVYPMLYNDDVNVPSVMKAFNVDYETALDYTPFGCGEYVLYHKSVGTPSGVINLANALNFTLLGGKNNFTGENCVKTKTLQECDTFDELLCEYKKQVEAYIDALALQEKVEYDVAGENAEYLFLSMLHDDCIERDKGIFGGGVRYLGGTLESYGDTNTADSLTAIKTCVFDKKLISKQTLIDALKADFVGYERERQLLLNASKYGNDNDQADEMASMVHQHVCCYTASQAEKVGLDNYLVVVINNSANSTFGRLTGATADGRKAGVPLANANNPMNGMDKNGVTAMLNSLVKLDTSIHAGAVQNLKLSKNLMNEYRDKACALIKSYFNNNGAQLMITCLSRGDLEDAMIHPEKHQSLIVRVGGFSARFVELDKLVQQEILTRTMHE